MFLVYVRMLHPLFFTLSEIYIIGGESIAKLFVEGFTEKSDKLEVLQFHCV